MALHTDSLVRDPGSTMWHGSLPVEAPTDLSSIRIVTDLLFIYYHLFITAIYLFYSSIVLGFWPKPPLGSHTCPSYVGVDELQISPVHISERALQISETLLLNSNTLLSNSGILLLISEILFLFLFHFSE